jgi:hypothetical protein
MFEVLKFDDLNDMAAYDQLKAAVEKSLSKVKGDYE